MLSNDIDKIENLKLNNTVLLQVKNSIENIFFLINDCKDYGTLPFSGIARCAFVGTKILRTLVKNKILTQNDYNLSLSQ